MNQDQDFSKLQNLFALTKLDMPKDTQVDDFLVEFHRRQRAQLLVPASRFTRAIEWLKEKAAGFEFTPSLGYGSALAAVALTAFFGLSQQAVTSKSDSSYQLSFHMPTSDSAFAMVGNALSTNTSLAPKATTAVNFTPNRADTATTRFVLANNPRIAYDATVAF